MHLNYEIYIKIMQFNVKVPYFFEKLVNSNLTVSIAISFQLNLKILCRLCLGCKNKSSRDKQTKRKTQRKRRRKEKRSRSRITNENGATQRIMFLSGMQVFMKRTLVKFFRRRIFWFDELSWREIIEPIMRLGLHEPCVLILQLNGLR